METLDRVMDMKMAGLSEEEIARQLQNDGVSPKDINEALSHARIKYAVNEDQNNQSPQGMQPSMMQTQDPQNQVQNNYPQEQIQTPQYSQTYQQQYPQEYQNNQNQVPQNYYQETPQAYSNQDYYYPSGIQDTQTISEIAEQIVIEKTEKINKKINEITSFNNFAQSKMEDIDNRLKRIENSIDKLQQAIIGKIGEFANTSEMIHQDLDNLHGTVSNLMNPLIDNINELKKINKKE